LPRAGTRSGPLSRHYGVPGKNGWPVLGLLRSPAQGKPAHYRAAAHTLIVVSGLAPRWRAKLPSLQTLRCARQNGWPVLGLLRSPAQGKPAHYRAAAHTLIVVSGLVPRWGAKRPSLQTLRCARQKRLGGFGAAPQPGAGQACSLQGSCTHSNCGERACPALGREAAPNLATRFV